MWTESSHSGKDKGKEIQRGRTRKRERERNKVNGKQTTKPPFTGQNTSCKKKTGKKEPNRSKGKGECTRMYISLILCAGRHIVNKIKWNDRGKGLEDSSSSTRTRRWMAEFVSLEPRINRMACRYRVHSSRRERES